MPAALCDCGNARAGKAWEPGECVRCYHRLNTPSYQRRYGVKQEAVARPTVARPLPVAGQSATACVHRGDRTGARGKCSTCKGDRLTDLFHCAVHGVCHRDSLNVPGVRACRGCPDRTPAGEPPGRFPGPFGVVVGSYKWPSLIDLQVRAIRRTCGDVPILISSDDPATADDCRRRCAAYPDVTFEVSAERIGHTGGDLAAFRRGIVWAAGRQLSVVAKLSQRMLITEPGWLARGAADLLASGLPLASRRCRGVEAFDLRTEACLLDAAKWNTPAVLGRLRERRYWRDAPLGLNAETALFRVLQDCLGGRYWPWGLLAADRYERRPGVLWHTADPAEEYERLAAELGVTLDHDFHTDGWAGELAAGTYRYG